MNNTEKIRTLVCIGGGSGGHIMPIVILHDSLKDTPGLRIIWIGEKHSMDENKAKEYGIEFIGITAIKFRRHFSFATFLQPFSFIAALFEAWKALKKANPDALFCKGGGVALSVGIIGTIRSIPLFSHESDTVPGMTNRVLGFFSKKVFLGFDEGKHYFSPEKTETVGQWIDPVFLHYAKSHPCIPHAPKEKLQVMVQCGGLGSTKIFTEILRILPFFPEIHFTIALGAKNEHFYDAFHAFSHVSVKKWFFHEELAEAYARADIAIVRAAANTLAECELFGLRMIMIPLGIASFNHQTINAEAYLKHSSGHILLSEEALSDIETVLRSLQNYRKETFGVQTLGALPPVQEEIMRELSL